MARLGRGRRSKPIYLRGKAVTTPTPLVRKRVIVKLQNINRYKYYQKRNAKHFRLVRPFVKPPVIVYVRPKIIVEKVTINRPKVIARRNAYKPIILRSRVVPVVFQRPTQPLIAQRSSVSRFHAHRRTILIRSFVAPTKSTQPLIRRQRVVSRYHQHRKPVLLRPKVTTPIIPIPRSLMLVVGHNKTRKAYYLIRNNKPYIFYPRGGSEALPPPPDTGHHQMLFIDRFGIYV